MLYVCWASNNMYVWSLLHMFMLDTNDSLERAVGQFSHAASLSQENVL